MLSKRRFFTIVASLVVMICVGSVARAQSEESKIEVGVQFAALRNDISYYFADVPSLGGGGRMTFNLNKNIALEGEMNYFPSSGFYDVRKWQGQFGVKSGVRFNQVGFFGKLRPGFMRTSYDIPVVCIQAPCVPFKEHETNFSVDVGGVVEFYPARRMTVRFDAGDTVVRSRAEIFAIPLARVASSLSLFVPPRQTTHNLQINAGIGFRF